MVLVAWSGLTLIQFNQSQRLRLQQLEGEKQNLIKASEEHQQQKQNLEQLIQQKDAEIKTLKEAKAKIRVTNVAYAAPVTLSVSEQEAKLFIYNHESGNNPARWNSSGCVGLGQACPASKLLAVCPNLDYACEDAWFTNYAKSRYGGWVQSYNFWIRNHWW